MKRIGSSGLQAGEDVTCMFCDAEAMTTVSVEKAHDLSLCEAHLKRLRFLLGDYTVTFSSASAEPIVHPAGYWNVLDLSSVCEHEYDMNVSAPCCRKCGKPRDEPHIIWNP